MGCIIEQNTDYNGNMNIDVQELERLYKNNSHKSIIKKLTESNSNNLPFEIKLHFARAYINESHYDDAIVLLNSEVDKGENDVFWNYLLCYAYYQKGNFSAYSPDDIDLQKEQLEFYEIAKKYNDQGLNLDKSHERLTFLKPFINTYLGNSQKALKRAMRPKPVKVKITKEEYERKYSKIFDDYFDKISSDTLKLHRTADSWNWDEDYKYLFIIAKNKNTDLGTALMLFWQGQPLDYWLPYTSVIEVEEQNKKAYELLELLCQNITSNFYTRGSVAYNPKSDSGTNWTEEYNEQNNSKELETIFFQKTEGKKIKSIYTEGFPDGVWNKVDKLDERFYYK
ncbi:DUF4274 domain-containing protein [Flavobacteriaceae bacterium]|nr:DUF4274 domain-containing protein [Flavobacteriaceae bacterium]